jgi:hypothetical protein
VWAREQAVIAKCLVTAYLAGAPAVKSAVAESIFDLFKLDELDEDQRTALALTTGFEQRAVVALDEIFQEVESDRANRRTR